MKNRKFYMQKFSPDVSKKIQKCKLWGYSALLIFIIASLLFMTGCKVDLNTMLDDYNKNFTVAYDSDDAPQPGEEGFKADDLLLDKYFVCANETLNLCAPANCSYEWTLLEYDRQTKRKNFATLSAGSNYHSQRFIAYIPTSGLEEGYYKLRLVITDKEGELYTDNTVLVIYRDFTSEKQEIDDDF